MIFIDESGDWGFGKGGSKYTTISAFIPEDIKPVKNYIKRFKIKGGLGPDEELHASSMKMREKQEFLKGLLRYPFKIISITMKKKDVRRHLKKRPNIMFNYQAGRLLISYLAKCKSEQVIFDRRSVKVASGKSLFDYLEMEINVKKESDVELDFVWGESHRYFGLQAADIITNAIWRRCERKDSCLYNIIKKNIIKDKRLFF